MTSIATIPRTHDHDPLIALLVDRDQDTRHMYAEYLKLGNWRVDEASDGREALAKAIALHPDVIITETRLPGIDGITLCGILKERADTQSIPIIILTAKTTMGDVEEAFAAHADDFMAKPFEWAELLGKINRCLAGKQPLASSSGALRQS